VDDSGDVASSGRAASRRRLWPARAAIAAATASCAFGLAGLLWHVTSPNEVSSRLLGIPDVQPASLPAVSVIAISGKAGNFAPRVAAAVLGGRVVLHNSLHRTVHLVSAALSPSDFSVVIKPGKSAVLRLMRPGLYHYYDAVAAHPLAVVAGNQVVVSRQGSGIVPEGWLAVLPKMPASVGHLSIPAGQDLFSPKAIVTIVGASVVISNHDADAHNFVVDPASPAGAAFLIEGTDTEPHSGWKRILTVQRPGLYHVYCTLHTRVVGVVDGWHVVVPRSYASGFRQHNAMDAWIVALPVTVAL